MTTRLLTAREVAELLGVSAETVLRWTRRGDLPAIRLPSGAIRFREDALDAWMIERATPGRGVLAATTDAARDGRYIADDPGTPGRSTDVGADGRELRSAALAVTPRNVAATEHEES